MIRPIHFCELTTILCPLSPKEYLSRGPFFCEAKRIDCPAVPAMRTMNLCSTPGRILFHRSRSIALLGLFSVLVLPLYFSAWRLSSSALASEDTVFKATSTVQFLTLPYYHPLLEVSSTLYKRKVDRMACLTFPIRDHQREKIENKEPWGPRQELVTFLRRLPTDNPCYLQHALEMRICCSSNWYVRNNDDRLPGDGVVSTLEATMDDGNPRISLQGGRRM